MRRHLKKLHLHRHTSRDQTSEVPLSALQIGEKGVVIGIAGGRGVLNRITSLGFVPGTDVVILQNFRHGPIIVRVRDARIALGRGVARRIQVRRSEA